jgi:hypothetical protein
MQTVPMTKRRAKERNDLVNDGDKIWITVSKTMNLGQYENIKIEGGFSQTIKHGEDPIELIEVAEKELSTLISRRSRILQKKELRRKENERE